MSFTNYQVRQHWPELYARGLIWVRDCDPVPSKPAKALPRQGEKKIGRPRKEKSDAEADHEEIARLTGSYTHE
jgi:hypothetical protein